MDLISRISQHFADSAQTKLDAMELLAAPLAGAAEMMVGALVNNGKILACGNGGSAADAQHFAAELVGRFELERQGRLETLHFPHAGKSGGLAQSSIPEAPVGAEGCG